MKFLKIILLSFIVVNSANANITTYTDEAIYKSALAEEFVDSFDDLLSSDFGPELNRLIGSYSYKATSLAGYYVLGHTPSDNWLSTNTDDSLTISRLPAGFNAIGGIFFMTDLLGNPITGNLKISITDTNGAEQLTIINSNMNSFIGFISDHEISHVSFDAGGVGSGFYPTINNLSLGISASPVNEPLSLSLMLAGCAACLSFGKKNFRKRWVDSF